VVAVVPIALALILIKSKYFDIESAVERREIIGESIDDGESLILLSNTGGTKEIMRRDSNKDFGLSAVRGFL
jgi:hypothetical protein